MNGKNREIRLLKYFTLIMVIIMTVSSIFPVYGNETQVPETGKNEIKTQIKYDTLSSEKVGSEPYNQTKPGLFFAQYGEGKKSEYGFYVRVEEDRIAELYENYASFESVAVVEFLYREKIAEQGEAEGWKSGSSSILSQTKKTDEASGKEYIYLVLDTFDGGMKDLKAGKTYEIILGFYEKTETPERRPVCSTEIMEVEYTVVMKDSWKAFFAARAGVKLTENGINESIYTGLLDYIKGPMGWIMKLFYNLTANYLFAILLFAIVIKIALFPTGIKQQKNMVKQAKFAPKQRAIMNKYKGRNDRETQMKCQTEIQEAQQKEGISMMGGGCLSMILQMLILICLYGVIREPLTFMSEISLDAMALIRQYFTDINVVKEVLEGGTLNDISVIGYLSDNFTEVAEFLNTNFSYDLTLRVSDAASLPNFVLFNGFNMADTPSIQKFNLLLLVPVLVFFSYYFSMKITRKLSYQPPKMEGAPDVNASMKIMDISMPAISTFICFSVPAMLGIYWIFQSLLGIVQQIILKKMYPFPVYTEEDYKAAEREYKGKQPKEKKKPENNESSGSGSGKKVTRYDDDDEEYAVLEDKVSYYDLPKEEREKIDEKNNRSLNNKSKNSKSGLIEKPEIDKDYDKDNKN